jgi:hypothetical protein
VSLKNQRLLTKELPDEPSRRNMKFITDVLSAEGITKFEWQFFTFTVTGAVTNFKIPNPLKFIPTDILQTRLSGGTLTFNYDRFTDNLLDITTSGTVTFRGLAGRYRENEE